MRTNGQHDICIGFRNVADKSEFAAAEQVMKKHFGSRLEKCYRDGQWVVAQVKDFSHKDRDAFAKLLNDSRKTEAMGMPNIQAVGPT